MDCFLQCGLCILLSKQVQDLQNPKHDLGHEDADPPVNPIYDPRIHRLSPVTAELLGVKFHVPLDKHPHAVYGSALQLVEILQNTLGTADKD